MRVALTFDDGPCEHTTRILNTLQVYGGHVSFFVTGSSVEKHKGKIFRASQMGCEVACHAWDHQDFTIIDKRAIKKQLLGTIDAIKLVTGSAPAIFRPPYGRYSERVETVARKLKLSMVNWSVDSLDWQRIDASEIYMNILTNVKDGDIVLCHDIFDTTAAAMNLVIPELIDQGYKLVTVSELLLSKYGRFEPGIMYLN